MTEQGEVLADRYDDPRIAGRHLEQVIWATLAASVQPLTPPRAEWQEAMEELAQEALTAYRALIEEPCFLTYFEQATPILEIESLPIASRPAHRHGARGLSDLRAIPWVFAWTQNRCMIPAWYGLGSAFTAFAPVARGRVGDAARRCTRDGRSSAPRWTTRFLPWPSPTWKSAEATPSWSRTPRTRERIWGMISAEYERSRDCRA